MTQLSCPKCGAALARFERSGVVIERCARCRGVFLDRGELEHLIEVEGALLYGLGRIDGGQSIPDHRLRAPARLRRRRKIPVTERILDLG